MLSLLFGFNHLIFTAQDDLTDHEVTTHAKNLTGLVYIHRNNSSFFELMELLQELYTNIHKMKNTQKRIDELQHKLKRYDYITSVLESKIDLKEEHQNLFDAWRKSQFKDKTFHDKMEMLNKTIAFLSKSNTNTKNCWMKYQN